MVLNHCFPLKFLVLKSFITLRPEGFREFFFYIRGLVHHEFVPTGQTVSKEYYLSVLRRRKLLELWAHYFPKLSGLNVYMTYIHTYIWYMSSSYFRLCNLSLAWMFLYLHINELNNSIHFDAVRNLSAHILL